MKLSIIIPVYNQESFISKSIQSCLNQGLNKNEYEIIIVNDCSTDKSIEIINSVQQQYDNIIVIDKKQNEGVERARYSGYLLARGDYITFVDSDDYLEPKILQSAIDVIDDINVDYVIFGGQRVVGKTFKIKQQLLSPVSGLLEQPILFDEYYISFFGKNILPVQMWGKVYKKKLLDSVNLEPEGLSMGEDLAFNLKLFPYLKSIFIMEEVGYNYRYGGMTNKFNKHLYPDLRHLYILKKEKIVTHNYKKARKFIDIELKNVLKSEIAQQIIYKVGSESSIKSFICNELKSDIWNDEQMILNLTSSEDPIAKAILTKDSDKIYDLIYQENKAFNIKRLFKKAIINFFNNI